MYNKNNNPSENECMSSCFDSFIKILPIFDDDFDSKVIQKSDETISDCGSLFGFENPFVQRRDQSIESIVDEIEEATFNSLLSCENPFVLQRDQSIGIASLVDEIEEVAFVLGDEFFDEYFNPVHDDKSKSKILSSDEYNDILKLQEGIELIRVDFSDDFITQNSTCSDDDNNTSKNVILVLGYQSNNRNYYPSPIDNNALISVTDTDVVSWGNGADAISLCILAGVNLLKNIIESRIETVSHEIETTGEVLIENIGSECIDASNNNILAQEDSIDEFRDEFLMYTTGSVKRGAEKLRTNTMNITLGMRDIATNQIIELVDTMEEAEIGKLMIPNEENREMLGGLGKIVLTAVGAAGISIDVMCSSTEAVAKKSNEVAADVVTKTYGPVAGQAVGNTGDSIYNVFRSMKLLTLLNPQTMVGAVARETGKARINDNSSSSTDSTSAMDFEEIYHKSFF